MDITTTTGREHERRGLLAQHAMLGYGSRDLAGRYCLRSLANMTPYERLSAAIHLESAAIAPQTSELIEAAKEALRDMERQFNATTEDQEIIARLLAENSGLRAALKPFAEIADDFDADGRELKDSDGIYANTAGDFRRARDVICQQLSVNSEEGK